MRVACGRTSRACAQRSERRRRPEEHPPAPARGAAIGNPEILLSVVIPTYNYAWALPRAIGSVVPQLDERSELIVIDDGSTDETPQLLARLRDETGAAFRFVRKENGGPSSARNLGLRLARGRYLLFLDADDEILPAALAALLAHIEANPRARFVIGGHVAIDFDGSAREFIPLSLPQEPRRRLRAYLIDKRLTLCHGACAMDRAIFARAVYPEGFRSGEDLPVFAQALAGPDCTILPLALARIHKHADSLRHRFDLAHAPGMQLVDEIFCERRLGPEFQPLKPAFRAQRCLSLFRSAYLARDVEAAKGFYRLALQCDWRVVAKLSYTGKALRLWLG